MPHLRHTRLTCSTLLALLSLAACSDAITPAASGAGDPQPSLALAEDGALRDDGIDGRDTYFAFNVTTTRSVDGAAADGGVAIASLEEYQTDESAYLEAGYDTDGSLRFNVYSDGAADPRIPDPPPVVRSVGNSVYVYDQWGGVTETYAFNDFLEGAGLPGGDLAVGSPYGTLYNPIDSRSGGGGGPANEPIYMTGLDPERSKVHRVRDDVLQVTTTSGGETGVQAAAEGGAAALRTTRTYRRRGVPTSEPAAAGETGQAPGAAAIPHWVLESVEQTATVPGARGSTTVRTRTTYQYVAAHVNRGRDELREKALRVGGPPASAARGAAPAGPSALAQADELVTANSEDGINLCERGDVNYVRTVSPGGGGVVYQHGFCSDATTWYALRHRVPETHRVGVEQTYSLNSDANVESQVQDLTSRLVSVGVPGNVVVAHSQGGLVARRLGQQRPDLVSGVVTIGTPHEGALIASNPAGMLADQLHDIIGDPCFGLVCMLAGEVAEGVAAGLLARGVGALVPAAGDDQPNSALIQRVNGRSQYQYETFRRASISMNVPPRWAIFRMLGDSRSSRERLLRNEPLKGQRYARDAQRVYDAARVLRYMAMVLRWRATDYGYGWGCYQTGYAYYWEPCYNPYGYSYNWWRASYWYYIADALDYLAGTVIWVMDRLDRLWDEATTGRSGGTDGFVQLNSQQYPTYVPGTFPVQHFRITGAEAHSGETASRDVLAQLRPALDYAGLGRY